MSLARLLAVALLVCSTLAFAQKQSNSVVSEAQASKANGPGTTSDPWKFIPNPSVDTSFGLAPVDRAQIDQLKVEQFSIESKGHPSKLEAQADPLVLEPTRELATDATCFAIRSYVVARDDKNSDSTHPVAYSTCQPASRYRLRTTDAHPASLNR